MTIFLFWLHTQNNTTHAIKKKSPTNVSRIIRKMLKSHSTSIHTMAHRSPVATVLWVGINGGWLCSQTNLSPKNEKDKDFCQMLYKSICYTYVFTDSSGLFDSCGHTVCPVQEIRPLVSKNSFFFFFFKSWNVVMENYIWLHSCPLPGKNAVVAVYVRELDHTC